MSREIRRDTGISTLLVEDVLPDCDERIIYVVGPGNLDRTLILREEEGPGGERKFDVSAAQEALIRVWEIVESYSTAAEWCCRLLTVKGEEKIRSLAGMVLASCIRVLPTEEHPLCADISDDLIQITGDFLTVKKALLAVTFCLQGNISGAISQFHGSVSHGASHDLHGQKHLNFDTDSGGGGQTRINHRDAKEVAFRLLCPTYVADGLIGWGGSITKTLERETGARIEVLDPVVGCADCVIVVSAMENKGCQCSPAQEATLRVFTKLTEAASESAHASSSSRGESVTARLLITNSQANMLDMKDTAGAEVKIYESHCSPAVSVGKKIIQIVGEYYDVHTCLLQVTWTLRESIFSSKMTMFPLLPHKLYGRPSHVNAATTLADEIDNLTISHDTDISTSPTVLSSESSFGHTLTTYTDNQAYQGDVMASSSSSELGSGDECAFIRNAEVEVEVVVPAHVFSQVYGEGGCNLALLRQISGATVIVHDPSPGTDGKVFIRGTANQTVAAKSMLYCFIMV